MRFLLASLALLLLSGCSSLQIGAQTVKDVIPSGQQLGAYKVGKPYQIGGQWYYPQESFDYDETGIASWYGPGFHSNKTANGERYNQRELTAAHRTLQMPSFVRVTNLTNGRSVVLRVNDRGPYAKGRIIDVSEKAAELLDFKRNGVARVRVQVLPEASRQVAQAAKEGRTWRGGMPAEAGAVQPASTALAGPPRPFEPDGQPVAVHEVDGRYYPDPVVTQQPVAASSRLFVQAGSFSASENAERLATQLRRFGPVLVDPVQVRGSSFHRVLVGPYASIGQADEAVNQVSAIAPNARIIVE